MHDIVENKRGPSLGEPAPTFEATTKDYKVKLEDFKGNWVILFSHPDDLLPVFKIRTINHVLCKRKIKAIALGNRQSFDILSGRDFLRKYMVKHSLTIIDDSDKKVARSYGLDDSPDGSSEEEKGLFVIDPKGILRMKLFFSIATDRNFSEIMKLVEALQDADKERSLRPKVSGWKRHIGIVVKPKPITEQG